MISEWQWHDNDQPECRVALACLGSWPCSIMRLMWPASASSCAWTSTCLRNAGKIIEIYMYILIYMYIYRCIYIYILYVGIYNIFKNQKKFRNQTSTTWTHEKAEVGRVREEKRRRKKMQVCEKVETSRNTLFFQCFGAPEGRKVGALKRRVRSHLVGWEIKKLHAVVARSADLEVKKPKASGALLAVEMLKNWTRLWRKLDLEVKCKNLTVSDHFWKLSCQKSARLCGAKHISKSNCAKSFSAVALLEVEMFKMCMPLWREAHFEVKSVKNWRSSDHFW